MARIERFIGPQDTFTRKLNELVDAANALSEIRGGTFVSVTRTAAGVTIEANIAQILPRIPKQVFSGILFGTPAAAYGPASAATIDLAPCDSNGVALDATGKNVTVQAGWDLTTDDDGTASGETCARATIAALTPRAAEELKKSELPSIIAAHLGMKSNDE